MTTTSCGDFLDEYSQDMVVAKTVSHLDEVLLGEGYIKSTMKTSGPTNEVGGFFNILDDDVNTGSVGNETSKVWGTSLSLVYGYYAWQFRVGSNHNGTYFQPDNYTWDDMYSRINIINIILDEIVDMPHETDEDDIAYYRVIGEARFLRAYFFFTLANLYGDAYDPATADTKLCVPLKLTPYIEHDKDKPTQFQRNTVKEVYDQILIDLSIAEENLTRSPQASSRKLHRASLEAVELLYSRVYLYMQDWANAEAKADALIKMRGVMLSSIAALDGEAFLTRNNSEILFSQGANYMSRANLFAGNAGDYCVTRELRDLYEDKDHRTNFFGVHATSDSVTLRNKYERGDIVNHISDCFLLRTAEAYLNKAEACAMQDKSGDACDALNTLRRNRIEDYVNQSYTGDELVKEIRNERRKELCFEGHRWFDLRRYAVNNRYPYSRTIVHVYNACGDYGVSYTDTYVLEENDPAYTFALPESVINFDKVPMVDNIRKERKPIVPVINTEN
ncbi:MAG: RagB/SusD family nutrient uptake outer membrane protein [Muribaculaceae bacterium]|nr:RagB/SusD family nutrient uptake outer membrane protein [Muribaculaceae bacterium]